MIEPSKDNPSTGNCSHQDTTLRTNEPTPISAPFHYLIALLWPVAKGNMASATKACVRACVCVLACFHVVSLT